MDPPAFPAFVSLSLACSHLKEHCGSASPRLCSIPHPEQHRASVVRTFAGVLDAVRVTGLLLLQHLERRIGKQEERIRRLELLHQRDVRASTAETKTPQPSPAERPMPEQQRRVVAQALWLLFFASFLKYVQ